MQSPRGSSRWPEHRDPDGKIRAFVEEIALSAEARPHFPPIWFREIAEGGAPMSPEVARRVVELFRTVRPPAQAEYGLTPHELRLLRMLVDGHNYKTAAAELHVSVNTVSFHMRKVYDKLQVHSKSEAVAKALRDRLA